MGRQRKMCHHIGSSLFECAAREKNIVSVAQEHHAQSLAGTAPNASGGLGVQCRMGGVSHSFCRVHNKSVVVCERSCQSPSILLLPKQFLRNDFFNHVV